MTLFEALESVMTPGEDVGYSDLLERVKAIGFNTAGIGMSLERLAFRGYAKDWRGSEFITYRVPFFDREVAGDWTEGELRIVRKEPPDED